MDKLQEQLPCPICGKTSYSWGEVVAEKLKYVPEEAGFFGRNFSLSYRVPARLCDSCGNVQLFSAEFLRNN